MPLSALESGRMDDLTTTTCMNEGESIIPIKKEKRLALPMACIYRPELQLFHVIRAKGKALTSGGFGIKLSPAMKKQKKDLHDQQKYESITTETGNMVGSPISSNEDSDDYLFVEEALFLFETGFLEIYDCDPRRYQLQQGQQATDRQKPPSQRQNNDRQSSVDLAAQHIDNDSSAALPLEAHQIYPLLNECQVSFPAYLVYAHLRAQTFRVVRHTTGRRAILQAMKDREAILWDKVQQQQQQMQQNTNAGANLPPKEITSTTGAATAGEASADNDIDMDIESPSNGGEISPSDVANGDNTDTDKHDTSQTHTQRRKQKQYTPLQVLASKKKDDEKLQLLRRQLRQDAVDAPPPQLATDETPRSHSINQDNTSALAPKNGHATGTANGIGSATTAKLAFDIYNPNSAFSKASPGLPQFCVAITYYSSSYASSTTTPLSSFAPFCFGHVRDLLAHECRGIPLKLATVSDSGTVVMLGVTDQGSPYINQN